MNHKRVERIWRREGLKVLYKQPKRARLWLNDCSCVRLRPEYRNHVWSYDFVMDRTADGRAFRMLTVIDEHTRQCLAIRTERKLNHESVLETLTELFLGHGPPEHIRSDNGSELTAIAVRQWRRHYNEMRPHSSLGYKPPAPQTRESSTNWIKTENVLESKSMALSL